MVGLFDFIEKKSDLIGTIKYYCYKFHLDQQLKMQLLNIGKESKSNTDLFEQLMDLRSTMKAAISDAEKGNNDIDIDDLFESEVTQVIDNYNQQLQIIERELNEELDVAFDNGGLANESQGDVIDSISHENTDDDDDMGDDVNDKDEL